MSHKLHVHVCRNNCRFTKQTICLRLIKFRTRRCSTAPRKVFFFFFNLMSLMCKCLFLRYKNHSQPTELYEVTSGSPGVLLELFSLRVAWQASTGAALACVLIAVICVTTISMFWRPLGVVPERNDSPLSNCAPPWEPPEETFTRCLSGRG